MHVLAQRDAAAGLARSRQKQGIEQAKPPVFDRRIGQLERVLVGRYDRKDPQLVARLGHGFRTEPHTPPSCYGHELRKGLHRQYSGSLNGTVDNRCRDLALPPLRGLHCIDQDVRVERVELSAHKVRRD
jgi:hypothetical protein